MPIMCVAIHSSSVDSGTNVACSFFSVSVLNFVAIVVAATAVSGCKFQSVPCWCALCMPRMCVAMQWSSVD